ncbi:dynactin subunit 4 isoform X1, partial [Tachysurus ichikawai]
MLSVSLHTSPPQINKLIEYYQHLAQREKLERDRKKLARRRPFMPQAFSINKLIEYYQHLAQREKLERDRKKLARRRPFMPQAFS